MNNYHLRIEVTEGKMKEIFNRLKHRICGAGCAYTVRRYKLANILGSKIHTGTGA